MRRGRCQRKHHLSSRLRPHLLVPMRLVAVRQGTTHRCRPGRIKERRLWRVATRKSQHAACIAAAAARPCQSQRFARSDPTRYDESRVTVRRRLQHHRT